MYATISYNAFNYIYGHNIGTIHLMTLKPHGNPARTVKSHGNYNI